MRTPKLPLPWATQRGQPRAPKQRRAARGPNPSMATTTSTPCSWLATARVWAVSTC